MLPSYRQSATLSLLLTTAILLGNSALAYAEETGSTNPAAQSQETTVSETTAPETTTSGTVARAIFTSQIVDREPADTLTELANDTQRVYFFTDLRGLTDQIITHQWEYNGNVMAEVKFKVGGGPRWRVYSSKNLLPDWTGEWKVSVIDENGSTLNVSKFTYVPAASPDSSPNSTVSTDQQKN